MNEKNYCLKVVNEDGTDLDTYPKNPLFKIYPTCDYIGYKCIYCGECPCGEYFDVSKLSQEQQDIYNTYVKEAEKYNLIHNPSLSKKKKFHSKEILDTKIFKKDILAEQLAKERDLQIKGE